MPSEAFRPGLAASSEILAGTRIDVSHIAATPVGMRVTAHTELSAVDGRKLTFRVWANDETECIGEGTHERIVVEVTRFDRRAREKSARAG
jgi:fluoroacetyl-CoA thioesterase